MGTTAVILGGGYAGVMAANRLAGSGRPGLDVVLATPDQRFVERIRLHEYAAGTRPDATVDFDSLLHPAVHRVTGRAVRIRPAERTVQLADGRTLAYDYLVYAVGSAAAAAPDGAVRMEQLQGATAARGQLAALPAGARVAVVGGGLTAVETAAETARTHGRLRVSLHSAEPIAPRLGTQTRRSVEKSLRRAGVELHSGTPVRADGDVRTGLGADVVLWCAGFAVPGLAAASGLPVNDGGRLCLDSTLRVRGQDRIYGAGDAGVIDDPFYDYLRMCCAAALPMGADAAGNILRALDGTAGVRHDSGFRGLCISLGRSDGAVQFLSADDSPTRFHLHGRTAAVQKEIICRMTLRWIRGEAKRSGAYTWPTGPQAATTAAPAPMTRS
ncbi:MULTISPECIES: FAD-dependent oxidoreductase [unclassified Arthrobacter]|uniref:NAD(P)/FAD-dependent oxidoreductase n=1 Tax=unclassified Arthrobacter TaxID=235627 RepID=UPI001E4BA9D5|nr:MULTISPECIES: FAD-dependent oxidoreductase [unclassified Arthrobacter]MCC9145251.1 FAD-dependent oxidoreductase [Arthrobacter sp. zg-Y919]MDK1276479.1 FAD-dependent oxidoreductase [Arthrobacter sp. zg.Y919]WIB01922.1 FAD-dependent oxidoreductase [Arthrobacter sp. zg-Y919]